MVIFESHIKFPERTLKWEVSGSGDHMGKLSVQTETCGWGYNPYSQTTCGSSAVEKSAFWTLSACQTSWWLLCPSPGVSWNRETPQMINLLKLGCPLGIPRCSTYGMFTYICPKNGPNVGKYSYIAYGYVHHLIWVNCDMGMFISSINIPVIIHY